MNFYSRMDPYELVGHVNAIPDASEMSLALAARMRELLDQVAFYQAENRIQGERITERNTKVAKLEADLENAMDKIAGFMELTDPNQQKLFK